VPRRHSTNIGVHALMVLRRYYCPGIDVLLYRGVDADAQALAWLGITDWIPSERFYGMTGPTLPVSAVMPANRRLTRLRAMS
jgi:hypothetical protein